MDNGWMNGWWMDGWMTDDGPVGWMDDWTDGWMDAWMEGELKTDSDDFELKKARFDSPKSRMGKRL